MPTEMPILDGAACSECSGQCASAVEGCEDWRHHEDTGAVLCPACTGTCEECGRALASSEINAHNVCERCEDRYYTSCDGCGDRVSQDDTTHGYCSPCAEDMGECSACGTFRDRDSLTFHEGHERDYCASCFPFEDEDEDVDEDSLHDYSYRPDPNFAGADLESLHYTHGWRPWKDESRRRKGLFFGVELECESTRGADIGAGVSEVPGRRFYCKRDGSLSHGMEIVSHPATWEYWRKTDLSFLDRLRRMGFRAYDTTTCGMHVHVSRNVLSPFDVFKLLRFAKNAPLFMLRVSRRKAANLNQWAAICREDQGVLVLKAKGDRGHSNRYEAINVTGSSTVEFRLFRGTLDKYAVLRNLAFVRALIAFVQETSLRRLSSDQFRRWLKSHGWRVIGRNHAESILQSLAKEIKEHVSDNCSA